MDIVSKWSPTEVIASCGDLSPAECISRAIADGASFHRANLSGLDLSGADLRGGDFLHADFINTNLSDADLRDADVRWANFGGANLSRANIEGMWTFQTNFGGSTPSGNSPDAPVGGFHYDVFPEFGLHGVVVREPGVVAVHTRYSPVETSFYKLMYEYMDKRGMGGLYDLSSWGDLNRPDYSGPGREIRRLEGLVLAIQDKIGSQVGPLLGSGRHGSAFAMKDGRTLKITNDLDEFRTAQVLMNLDEPNLVKVHDAFIFRSETRDAWSSTYPVIFYMIVRDQSSEVLANIPELKPSADLIMGAGLRANDIYENNRNLQNAMREMINSLKGKLKLKSLDDANRKVIYDVVMGMSALYNVKIDTIDIHPRNIGINGRAVIFDIGSSESPYVNVPAELLQHSTKNEADEYFRYLSSKGHLR